MKNVYIFSLIFLLSCTADDKELTPEPIQTQHQLHVSVQPFDVSMEPIGNRSGSELKDASAINLSFSVFSGSEPGNEGWGSPVYTTTQKAEDYATTNYEGFGDISCVLSAGKYTLVAVLNSGTTGLTTITSPSLATAPDKRFRETWSATRSIDLNSESSISLQLPRISAQLIVEPTIAQPDKAKYLRLTLGDPDKPAFDKVNFSPSTGLAVSAIGENNPPVTYTLKKDIASGAGLKQKYTYDIPLGLSGQGINPSTDTQVPYGQILSVLLEVLDTSENILYSHSISAVTFCQGSQTTVKGPLYTSNASGTITAQTAWGTPIDGGW